MYCRLLAVLAIPFVCATTNAVEFVYSITVDGKAAGDGTMTIKALDGGVSEITAKLAISSDGLSMTHRCTERWKDGRLIDHDGSGTENGKKGGVALTSGTGGYALKAGVKDVTIKSDVWPTTFLMRPDADTVVVVDVLTGEVSRAKIERIGAGRLTVGDRPIDVFRYRLTAGGRIVDVWYDKANRLVRRAWSQNGHNVVVVLTGQK